MNLKVFTSTVCMALSGALYPMLAMQTYPVGLQTPPETSKVTQTYDKATGIYTIHVDENSFGDDSSRPTIRFAELTEPLPDFARTLAFEFKATKPCGQQKFYMYKLFKGSLKLNFTIDTHMEVSDEWTTYRIPVGDYVDRKTTLYGKKAGQYQDLVFMDFVTGTDIMIRNIHYEGEEIPFTDVTVKAGQTSLIEAENFNISAKDEFSHYTRSYPAAYTPYIDPTPGIFPIYAFTSVDYWGTPGMSYAEIAEIQNKKYRDMEAAGFTITEGGTWPAIDRCFLFDGLTEYNGYQANLHDGCTRLKMILRNGVDDSEVIRRAMTSPRLAGYVIKDEPFASDVNGVISKARKVLSIDNTHLIYTNLIGMNYPINNIGYKNYDEYVHAVHDYGTSGVISFDFYPIQNHSQTDDPNEENTVLMPNYFKNIEAASKFSRYYGKPWWGFIRAMSSQWNQSFNFRYPEPREDQMRFQAFANLAYGAQGMQYWPYVNCDGTYDAPCASDGSLNPSYYYAKAINTEIHNLTWVFLGAELIYAGHTNPITPEGCLRLTKNILPAGVDNVTTSGSGMLVTTLQNGHNIFLTTVNTDIWHSQSATLTFNKAVKQVLPDGTTKNIAAGTHTQELPVGGYLIYLVDENAPEFAQDIHSVVVRDTYRGDVTDVPFIANSEASNGFLLADMGHYAWANYSMVTPDDEARTITRDQAFRNWGAWYAYTFDVAEDMTVDISIGHSVPWSEYGRVASVGAKPGVSYTIEGEPELNWPKQYAASMTLSIDGETIIPAHSIRPSVPEMFDENGAEFNAILVDKSRWIPTDGDENLYFWPKAGGDNDVTPVYNAAPDYRGVTLTAGTHRIVVRSNCYPWNFDAIKIAPADMSGIDNVTDDTAATLKATGVNGGILVETDAAFAIYNLSGVQVAGGQGSSLVDLAAGLYIVVADKTSVKVLAK